MKQISLAIITILALWLTSCLENNIPYARIQGNFESIAAEGQSKPALIDTINRTITFYLPEQVNIAQVNIESYTLQGNAKAVGDTLDQPFDLTTPKTVTLFTYQNWQWTLQAVQNIERYLTLSNQVGESVIDVPAHRVIAYVSKSSNISALKVENIKLGPDGSTMSPDLQGQTIDFTHPVEVMIDAYGTPQKWTIYVDPVDEPVTTLGIDAWSKVAWLQGMAEAGAEMGAQYRLAGDSEWLDAPKEWLTVKGGNFTVCLQHLIPETTYEVRATAGSYTGQAIQFTTQGTRTIPNGDFNSWWLDGRVWNPWAEGGQPWWDTGNKGATTIGPSNTQPTDDTPTGTGRAAMLETKFVGVGILGKLAAGSIFAGSYVRTDGTNGILSFGREWDLRPTRLKGYWKYKTAPISSVTSGLEYMKGQPDTCVVWIALIDSDEPFEIRTRPENRNLFDPDGPEVVAYGRIQSGSDISAYTPFTVNLVYKSTARKPKYILIACSASKYGDYFTGGNGAILYIDDLTLDFDY